ncbi:MAG: primosomal protein N' [Lachnospiraceae bacterium]|nr:primosomal protein N' [Lachnospiraceae bacterium]
MSEQYADVIIDISHEQVDRPFCYRIPASLSGQVFPGVPVQVPFGRGNAPRKGYCVAVTDEKPDIDPARIKDIASVARDERSADAVRIRLAAWMRRRYGSTMIQALRCVLPAHRKMRRRERRFVSMRLPEHEARDYLHACVRKKHVARARLTQALLEAPDRTLPVTLITGKLHVTTRVIREMEQQGIVRVRSESAWRNPVESSLASSAPARAYGDAAKLVLSDEQQRIVDGVIRDFDTGHFGTSLIHGVTGSGKTEVYIRMIEEIVSRGRQAIVLIPEIALTYQTLIRFYRHFGDRVSVMNSTLSAGEKSDQFARAKEGGIDVMIGPRSALFTPFEKLGLIIIDEEHEPTYKSENMPKYHARDTAIALAGLMRPGASVVLGSATPSLEAYAMAKAGTCRLYTLTKRLTGGELARVHIADLREELRAGNRSVFSAKLQELMEQRFRAGEQTMLFLNRRGLHGFVSCRSCGEVIKCPHCDVSLSEHRGRKLVCHYCGHTAPMPDACPACASPYISSFRAGTQQIEDEVKAMLPEANVLRMDADTTRTKHSYEEILSAFANGEADVLVGTQMIVKGHDFPNVTLVGVLAADLSLNVSDFRSSERTFQLLVQAAGRAGRGEKKGDVVIQTYCPEHYAIRAAAKQDYPAFFEEEYGYRQLLKYPPAARMLAVQVFSDKEQAGMEAAQALHDAMRLAAGDGTVLIGPAPAVIGRVDDVWRFVVYVKDAEEETLIRLRTACEQTAVPQAVQLQFDFDPVRGF